MEITQEKVGDCFIVTLAGRLDANWCGHVEKAFAAAIRAGEHHIQADMAAVRYMSSLGIRVLFATFKQLRGIKGNFGVVNPSDEVRNVLRLAGFNMLIAEAAPAVASPEAKGRSVSSERASYEVFELPAQNAMQFELAGNTEALAAGVEPQPQKYFDKETIALGIGALGVDYADCSVRFGEFVAIAGAAACQPSDGSSHPDFMRVEASLIPHGFLYLGLSGKGDFTRLARFEATGEKQTVELSELAETALRVAGCETAVIAAVTETSALVAAWLRKSPSMAQVGSDLFEFPKIRDWISFTSDRAHRETTSLIVGVVSSDEEHPIAPMLRPAGRNLLGHFHAACFPYRPLQKGQIDLHTTVHTLFDSQTLQAVLHLLCDPREIQGAGESEFLRGALWIAPLPGKKS